MKYGSSKDEVMSGQTETGAILSYCRKSKKAQLQRVKKVDMYRAQHKLTHRECGLYQFPNGDVIESIYPRKSEARKFESILNMK
jgi:hypothetical protein